MGQRSGTTPEACVSSVPLVRKILVTGMSGTGKSTALVELARQGFDDRYPRRWPGANGPSTTTATSGARIGSASFCTRARTYHLRLRHRVEPEPLLPSVRCRRLAQRACRCAAAPDRLAGGITNDFGKDDQEREAILRDLAVSRSNRCSETRAHMRSTRLSRSPSSSSWSRSGQQPNPKKGTPLAWASVRDDPWTWTRIAAVEHRLRWSVARSGSNDPGRFTHDGRFD